MFESPGTSGTTCFFKAGSKRAGVDPCPDRITFAALALCALVSSWPLAALAETPFIRQSHPVGQVAAISLQVDLNNDGIPDLLTTDREKLTVFLSGLPLAASA